MSTIISPAERLSEPRGARIAVIGPNGVGKTTLAKTLDPVATLFVDIENGGLAVADHPMPHVRPQDWPEIRDLFVRIAGPNRSFAAHEPYSVAHFDRVGGWFPGIENYETVFVDTLTAMARLSYRWASQQPESLSDRSGRPDLRSTFGLHAREAILAIHHLQGARGKNVILTGAMDSAPDDFGRIEHRLQAEGQRLPRELIGIVDIFAVMNFIDFGDGKPVRCLVCTSPNPWGYPAKDRSGKLDQIEPPDLGALIRKILPPKEASHPAVVAGKPVLAPVQPSKKERSS